MFKAAERVIFRQYNQIENLKKEKHGLTNTFTTQVPLIVNTKEVKRDEELILQWDLPRAKPKPKQQKPSTWVDHVAEAERKRRKKCDER